MNLELFKFAVLGPARLLACAVSEFSRTVTREKKHVNWRPVEGNVLHECAICT
jgi:hypothetical protein